MPEVFPITLLPVKGWRETLDFQNLEERGRGARVQVVETLTTPVWEASGHFELSVTEEALLRTFWAARRNAGESFYFYSALSRLKRLALACGTGDGTVRVFPAPVAYPWFDTITPVAYAATTAKVLGTDFMLGVENRIKHSENLSDVTAWPAGAGATVTRTAGQTDPEGGSTAWRIASTGGSAVTKLRQAIGSPTAAQVQRISIWVKNTGAAALTILDAIGGTTTLAGSGSAWQEVILTTQGTASASTLTFDAPAAGAALTFFVWHPWAAWTHAVLGAPESTWCYIPTPATAITAHASGCWQVVFFPAATVPAAAQAVTLDVQGRERRLVRFAAAAPYDPEPYRWNRFRVGVKLMESAT